MWVRGLKHEIVDELKEIFPSHPVWVRGLKQKLVNRIGKELAVAPRVGAWIETDNGIKTQSED